MASSREAQRCCQVVGTWTRAGVDVFGEVDGRALEAERVEIQAC
jgi:hypothetical protein